MPSEAAPDTESYTARCYCGASVLSIRSAPEVVSYCHCADCRRWTGAPVGAFVAFPATALPADALPGRPVSLNGQAERWSCPDCGSPMAARFAYLPGQVYVPVGVLDEAARLAPALHSHIEAKLPWLEIADDLPKHHGSGREALLGQC